MNFKLFLIFILLIQIASGEPLDADIDDVNVSSPLDGSISGLVDPLKTPEEPNYSAPIPKDDDQHFDEYDAGSDMVGEGVWSKGPTIAANEIYETFGKTRGFIFSFITYNIDPEKIPLAKEYNDQNQNLAVILAVLFIIGESLATSMASANYPAYKNVFGDKDFSQKKFVGGGFAMIAGLGAAWIFRGIMILINLVDAWLMFQVMDAIKPSIDNGLMYFAMALIELVLFAFFLYRQILIGAMYVASPIYGVLWASGYMKEFVDSIGDKFIRALIMQPLCIFITVIAISIMKVMEWNVFGITVWDADNELTLYVFLLAFLVGACIWCLTSKFTIIKRAVGLAVFKKV